MVPLVKVRGSRDRVLGSAPHHKEENKTKQNNARLLVCSGTECAAVAAGKAERSGVRLGWLFGSIMRLTQLVSFQI